MAASPRALTEYVPGWIWLKEYPVRFAGCQFDARMCVIRLSNGGLWIHSPCPLDAATKAEIDALGPVQAIVAPGNYHHLHVQEFADAYPHALVHVCPGVEQKNPGLARATLLTDDPDSSWLTDLDQVLIRGTRFIQEVAFFHRPSKTLILVDLIENIGDKTPQANWVLRLWWKYIFKMWNRPKPAPEYQLGWEDKDIARECLERILVWDFSRIVIAHGDLIEDHARDIAWEAWRTVLQGPAGSSPRYGAAEQVELAQDFDHTCALMQETLVAEFGAVRAQQMRVAVRNEFNALLPEIPRISGVQARMLNAFLQITAQELAAYRGLKKLGMAVDEIWPLCHQAIRLRAEAIPAWRRWLIRQFMFSPLVRKIVARRASRNEVRQAGGFKIEYLAANDRFDLGVNYRGCGNYNFVKAQGGAEFAPYVCMSDIALSEAFGWGLVRTQTLADGCDHCDFRMTKGGPTQITSRTPEVQKLIDLIEVQERQARPSESSGAAHV